MCALSKALVAALLLSLGVAPLAHGATGDVDPFQPDISSSSVQVVMAARTDRLNNQADRAIEKLEPLVQQNPAFYSALYGLGLSYARKGDAKDAIKWLKRALAVRESQNLRDVSIYNSLGWLYLTSGNYKSAQQLLSEAAGYEPQNSRETNA